MMTDPVGDFRNLVEHNQELLSNLIYVISILQCLQISSCFYVLSNLVIQVNCGPKKTNRTNVRIFIFQIFFISSK